MKLLTAAYFTHQQKEINGITIAILKFVKSPKVM
jgi:hypothetical protein